MLGSSCLHAVPEVPPMMMPQANLWFAYAAVWEWRAKYKDHIVCCVLQSCRLFVRLLGGADLTEAQAEGAATCRYRLLRRDILGCHPGRLQPLAGS